MTAYVIVAYPWVTESRAQSTYPAKPIRLIVPFPPGGSNDIVGRYIGQKLAARLGQPIVIDNRAGADAIIGTQLAAGAAADGYTFLSASITHTMTPATQKKLSYDPVRSFTPVALIGTAPVMIATFPPAQINTLKELIALAKAKPGQIQYASSSAGGLTHFAGELFNLMAGVKLAIVPYKGGAPAITDAIAGQVSMTFSNQPTALPHVKTGKLRGIAVTSIKRSSAAPELPTIDESGIKGFDVSSWVGVNAPANLPREIVSRLNAEIVKGMSSPAGRERLNQLAFDPVLSTPDQYAAHIKAEVAKWAQVAKTAGAKLD